MRGKRSKTPMPSTNVVSERDSVRVLVPLENPPEPTPALLAAARRRLPAT
jgi:uncharacterized protein (DUF1778 family)